MKEMEKLKSEQGHAFITWLSGLHYSSKYAFNCSLKYITIIEDYKFYLLDHIVRSIYSNVYTVYLPSYMNVKKKVKVIRNVNTKDGDKSDTNNSNDSDTDNPDDSDIDNSRDPDIDNSNGPDIDNSRDPDIDDSDELDINNLNELDINNSNELNIDDLICDTKESLQNQETKIHGCIMTHNENPIIYQQLIYYVDYICHYKFQMDIKGYFEMNKINCVEHNAKNYLDSFVLCKEGTKRSHIDTYLEHKQKHPRSTLSYISKQSNIYILLKHKDDVLSCLKPHGVESDLWRLLCITELYSFKVTPSENIVTLDEPFVDFTYVNFKGVTCTTIYCYLYTKLFYHPLDEVCESKIHHLFYVLSDLDKRSICQDLRIDFDLEVSSCYDVHDMAVYICKLYSIKMLNEHQFMLPHWRLFADKSEKKNNFIEKHTMALKSVLNEDAISVLYDACIQITQRMPYDTSNLYIDILLKVYKIVCDSNELLHLVHNKVEFESYLKHHIV